MFEATKTRAVRGEAFAETYFSGSVLDIGCGPDLVVPHAQPFDVEHGDANEILNYLPAESFDCVHSSHCLEHMMDPPRALGQWWALVRPGGFLIIVVPDEDLYEQGVWPSAFNPDHKATFRIDRPISWSPVSYDIRALAAALPNGAVIDCTVQDHSYDRRMMRDGPVRLKKLLLQVGGLRADLFRKMMRHELPVYRISQLLARLEHALGKPVDQTQDDALAQIQVIVRKLPVQEQERGVG
jgi:SAM-dependent methyltransferase